VSLAEELERKYQTKPSAQRGNGSLAFRNAINETLELAAKKCEEFEEEQFQGSEASSAAIICAERIRALKSPPAPAPTTAHKKGRSV
jgi:hypothetical protein